MARLQRLRNRLGQPLFQEEGGSGPLAAGEERSHVSERFEAPVQARPGLQIAGKFTLQRQIASGAYGTVFEAWDMFLARRVAIKLLHPHYAVNQDVARRFRREAQAAAGIQHPNVVCVLEVGKQRDGSFFIVQELLHGMTLRTYLDTKRPTLQEAISMIVPVMGGLTAAHRLGVIHRDIKPENIILFPVGSGEIIPKIIDFGVAKVPMPDDGKITANIVLGTVQYMAPEQARGNQPVDARADVWSVGMVLFELLTGVCYYDAPTPQQSLLRLVNEPPPRLEHFNQSIPAAVCAVVNKALTFEAEKRFPSIQVFCDELMTAYQGGVSPIRGEEKPAGRPFSPTFPPTPLPPMHSPPPSGLSGPTFGPPPVLPWSSPESDLPPPSDDIWGKDDRDEAPEGRGNIDSNDETPLLLPAMEYAEEKPYPALDTPEGLAEAAAQAVSDNALQDALRYAAQAIELAGDASPITGRMLVMQAIAHRWLGNYQQAEDAAERAMGRLPRGSVGWHAALGHSVIASGYMGRAQQLQAVAEDLRSMGVEVDDASSHFVTCCRLVVFLVRLGSADLAHKVLLDAQRIAHKHGARGPFIDAWSDVAHAELAVHEGDIPAYLRFIESAVDNFTTASDVRNACLQRANVGNAYMLLGAYDRAVLLFRGSLALAAPMQLDFVAAAKANLGISLAHLDQLDEALRVESESLEQCMRQGNRRFGGVCRIYLATIHTLRREKDKALEMAYLAVTASEGIPPVHAYAQATLANVLLMHNKPVDALVHSAKAMRLLKEMEGIEEGESLIRLTHALSLRGTHQEHREKEGRSVVAEARRRVMERASRIRDPRWRASFLENVPDNARVIEIANQWVGGEK